eukprot:jgi/Ulvmu1/6105/UM027_0083.1
MVVDVDTIIWKLHWALLPICCLMVCFCYLDRSNVAYMQLQLQLPPPAGMNFSSSLYGHASGLFFIGYSVFQIPSNIILARIGAPLWLAVIVSLWGLCAMMLAAMRGATHFLVLRVLLGVFEAGTFPGVWYHLTLFYPRDQLTLPLSVTKAAVMVSQLLSAPLAAVLLALDGARGLRGWQWLTLCEGAATVAVGLVLPLLLPAAPERAGGLTEKEAAWVKAHVSRPPSTSDLLGGLRFAALSPALWRLSLIYALKSCAAYALIFWTPLAIDDLLAASSGGGRGAPTVAVLLTAIPYTFAAGTAVAVGWSSHVRGERRLHTAVPFSIGAAILLAAPLLQGPWAAVPAFAALCAALSACNATGPITATVTRCLPPEAQAGGLAMWNSLSNVGGYFGPAVYGWLKERTGRNAPGMMAMGVVLALAALLVVTFDEDSAAAAAQHTQHALHTRGRKVTDELLSPTVNVVDVVASEIRSAVVPLAPAAFESGAELRSPLASSMHGRR